MGVRRLSSGDDNGLHTDEGEGGVDESRDETEEVTRRTLNPLVVVPSESTVPVAEAVMTLDVSTDHIGVQARREGERRTRWALQ